MDEAKTEEGETATHDAADAEKDRVAEGHYSKGATSELAGQCNEISETKDMTKSSKNTNAKDSNLEGVPIDRGWAWVILAGCVLYMVIFGGIIRSYGIFFLEFQQWYSADAAVVALMLSIQNIINSVIGMLVMTVGMKKMTKRTAVAIGGALFALSYILAAFTTDLGLFYFAQGIVGGVGMGMLNPPLIAMIGIYFKNHRGLANSIYTGSMDIGGFILAPAFTTLFDKYSYPGAMLISGGLLLNTLVSASVLRPPEWFKKRHKHIVCDGKVEASEPLLLDPVDTMDNNVALFEHNINLNSNYGSHKHDYQIQGSNLAQSDGALNAHKPYTLQQRTQSERFLHKSSKPTIGITWFPGDVVDDHLGSVIDVQASVRNENPRDNSAKGCCKLTGTLATMFDCNLIRNILFIQYLIIAFVTMSGMAFVTVFIPTYAKETGIPYAKIAIILSIISCIDLTSKITTGVITDRKWIRRTTVLGVAALATGTMCHFTRFFQNFHSVLIMSAVFACFNGLYLSMFATILIDCVGIEKFSSSLGFVALVHGTSRAVFFYLAGLLRDIYGSYVSTFHMCGCLCYIGGILVLLIPVVKKKLEDKHEGQKKKEMENLTA